ncbi:Phosphoheptose isomerase [Dissostichus eleginoides]|uniref:Phosphoheptose isomerase n=1 Tax=Dissostichus eleginoides TaxID=100907 RepID=A0AAD9BBG1_DISEL|nr:Phosphoheptose isomerase [Dissostichus eleginoides]
MRRSGGRGGGGLSAERQAASSQRYNQTRERLSGFVLWMRMSSITCFGNVDGYTDIATFSFVAPEGSFLGSPCLSVSVMCEAVFDSVEEALLMIWENKESGIKNECS